MATTMTPARGGHAHSATINNARIPTKFTNEPSVDWSNPENTRRMRAAIEKVRNELGREYDLVIGGRRVKTEEKTQSLNPAKPSEVVGVFSTAGAAEVEPAMQAALKAFETWKYSLDRGAHEPAVPREPSAARAQVRADGVDGLRGRQELARGRWRHRRTDRLLRFLRAGSAAAVEGRDAGAVAGRARLAALHPAGRGRGDSAVELPRRDHGRHDAGLDRLRQHRHPEAVGRLADYRREVLRDSGRSRTAGRRGQLLPRPRQQLRQRRSSSIPRRATSRSPDRRKWVCTSTSVPPMQQPGQIWIKRTILEMGGKDSIIVDADADLDAAVEGVASAAFGFSGQKCSACSRAIIDERIYDKFLQRLKERVEKITVGDPTLNPSNGTGGQREIDEDDPGLHREGRRRRWTADHRRRARHRCRRRLLHSADGDRRCRSDGDDLAAGDLWTGAGGDQVAQLRARVYRSPTTPSSA